MIKRVSTMGFECWGWAMLAACRANPTSSVLCVEDGVIVACPEGGNSHCIRGGLTDKCVVRLATGSAEDLRKHVGKRAGVNLAPWAFVVRTTVEAKTVNVPAQLLASLLRVGRSVRYVRLQDREYGHG